jgi:chorismate dehydratase
MRIGAVRFLNARPLLPGLGEWCAAHHAELTEDVPSRLTELLRADELDVGMIPAIDVVSSDEFCVIPGLCISSRGTVLSVRIWSKVPLERITSLALDRSSHSSATMALVLLSERGLRPRLIHAPPDLEAMLAQADAALLIGDPALQSHAAPHHMLDLGEAWDALTGLPFVFAVWAARRDRDLGAVPAALLRARKAGAAAIDDLVAQGAARLNLPAALCDQYLKRCIRYDLDDAAVAGLRRFGQMAEKHGIIKRYVEPRFYAGA